MSFYWEINQEINRARNILEEADQAAEAMAKLLKGRLRHCSSWDLRVLKRELRGFNITTGEWKS